MDLFLKELDNTYQQVVYKYENRIWIDSPSFKGTIAKTYKVFIDSESWILGAVRIISKQLLEDYPPQQYNTLIIRRNFAYNAEGKTVTIRAVGMNT